MLARLATFNSTPANADDPNVKLLRETVSGTPGFVAGFHLRDPQTDKAFSLTVYEDADAAQAAGQRMQARPADKRVGVEPDTVQWLEAHPF
jgi:heme-degrading monooxygenase HmoA